MTDNIMISLFLGGGFFVGLFIALLMFVEAARRNRDGVVMGAVLVLSSINLVHPHLFMLFPTWKVFLTYRLFEPVQFLIPPLVFIYVRNHLRGSFRLVWRDLIHGLPVAGVLSVSFIPALTTWERRGKLPWVSILFWLVLMGQAGAYLWLSARTIGRYQYRMKELFSSMKGIDLGWLRLVFVFFLVYYGTFPLPLMLLVHFSDEHLPKAVLSLIQAVMIWVSGVRVLSQKAVPREAVGIEPNTGQKPLAIVGSEDERLLVDSLRVLMEGERLYLNPDLTLDHLVKRLGFSRNEVSWALNSKIGKNFYSFVNEYRVRHVQAALDDPTRRDNTLLALAYEAGFNSKPAFNRIFKEMTGRTPSQYRKSAS